MKKLLFIVLLMTFAISCTNVNEVEIPVRSGDSILEGTIELGEQSKLRMEGVYRVVQGHERFGSTAVLKWSNQYLSLFFSVNAAYFVNEAGHNNNDIFIEGYWRFANNRDTGLGEFRILPQEGGLSIINNEEGDFPIIIRGFFGDENDSPSSQIVLQYDRPFSEKALNREFYILAHRGAGRTSDGLAASENTLEMLDLAERFGANAVEIDVKNSKDGVPFLYHDKTINLRLTQKGPIWGEIEEFNMAQLKSLITLIRGERIPTLREALEHILDNTGLELVWLDMKSKRNDMAAVIDLQQEITQRAQNQGRKLEIFIGLPNEEKIEHFQSHPDWETTLSLCELELADVERTKADFWGPRWTLGYNNAGVEQMHSQGKRVITWTMDEGTFIHDYIENANFDGMVTNYPTLVAFYHWTR